MVTITNLTTKIKVVWPDETQYFCKGSLNIWSVDKTVYIADSTKIHREKPWSINVWEVSGALTADDIVTTLLSYDDAYSPTITSTASNIATAAVITAITTESNWSTGVFVDPGGILAQITSGQTYTDTTNNIMYHYNGSVLSRYIINNPNNGVLNLGVYDVRAKTYNFANATAVAGTGDAITINFVPDLPALTAGLRVTFIAEAANTGAATLAVDGGTAKAIEKYNGAQAALAANDIRSGQVVEIVYNGTAWIIVSPIGN